MTEALPRPHRGPRPPAAARSAAEAARRRQLTITKRRATALLAAVSAVFLVAAILGGDAGWAGYVQATAAAAMVGGLADWFAVTALFRHPLGLPIPHTAIVVERKDQFGRTLGDFIRESFLTPEVLVERVRQAEVVPRVGRWLSEPANASRLAGELADAAVAFSDLLRDDDVHRVLEDVVRDRVEAVPLAPLGGRALRFLTENGRSDDVIDTALRALDRFLHDHRDTLRQRFGQKSPWWMPGAVENRIFDRLLEGARTLFREMASDRDHELRRQFTARLGKLAVELETSPELRDRGEQLKHEILAQPELREWVTSLWRDAKAELRAQACDAESELRRRMVVGIVAAGRRLQDDQAIAATVQSGLESAVTYIARNFDGEIASVITGTIARWDARETADRLELLLGPDLQYVRINGTVVGGLAGLILHAVSDLLA
ncbi:MAG: DUF445 domain-containing protein [Actinomycetota bacterium]|nr:DUF445 domain-containing protein [Actinomycetota bacterium]